MIFFFVLIAFCISIRTISYGIFEIKKCENKFGGIFVIFLSIFSLIFSTIMILFR